MDPSGPHLKARRSRGASHRDQPIGEVALEGELRKMQTDQHKAVALIQGVGGTGAGQVLAAKSQL